MILTGSRQLGLPFVQIGNGPVDPVTSWKCSNLRNMYSLAGCGLLATMEGPSFAPAIPGWPRVDGCPMVVREDISQARKASRH